MEPEKETHFPAFPYVYLTQKRGFTGRMEMQQQVNPGISELRLITSMIVQGQLSSGKKENIAEAVLIAQEILRQTDPRQE